MSDTMKHYLFCPGPVNTAQNIRAAAFDNEIGHREKEFETLFANIQKKILEVFEVSDKKKYFPVVVSGSGSAANEAVLSSIVGKQRILVIANGEFGERLYATAKLHNPYVSLLKFPWGDVIDLQTVEKYLKTHKVDIIAMVHHETCSGMLNPVAQIGKLAKKYKLTFFLDAVSSAGAEKIDLEKWNVTFCSTSASKALASLPGVSIVIGKTAAFKKLKTIPAKTMYLNLYKFYEFATGHNHTPNTPAVPLFFALDKALENILAIGPEQFRKVIADRTETIRNGCRALGLSFLIDEEYMSSSLTTIRIPAHVTVAQVKKKLREKNIIIYDGKGVFKGKVFQVANIGEITSNDITFFLDSLQEAIRKLPTKKSKAVIRDLTGQNAVFPFMPLQLEVNSSKIKHTTTK